METKKRGRPRKEAAQNREDKRVIGRPFQPGNCANPGGRPKMSKEEREAWQALATKCRTKIEELVNYGELPPATLAKFAELALDRAYGKAIQSVDISPGDGGGIEFSFVDPPSRSTEQAEAVLQPSPDT